MKAMTVLAALVTLASPVAAQSTHEDLTARLREVLPAAVAERVIATVSDARSKGLPSRVLEQRALMFAAKGVNSQDIARSIAEQSRAMGEARAALARGGSGRPADADVAAGADVIRRGVDGAQISTLAQSAPSGRSLAVPLAVISSLVDRGLPSDVALASVLERLKARASDAELSQLPEQAAAGRVRAADASAAGRARAAEARGAAGARRAGAAGGAVRGAPPANVPPAAGGRGRPAGRGRP